MLKKALFLDRDGVINVDHGYVHTIKDLKFIDGIFDLCSLAISKNYLIIVITNQAGIGRGFYSVSDFELLTDWMCNRFALEGILISKVYFSPYHPEHGLGAYKKNDFSRKPNPGMLIEAKADFNLQMSDCVLVGDKITDIQAGHSAGVGMNILFSSSEDNKELVKSDYVGITSLKEANQYL
jgi:D-glycero-D-manno-heptose 1,7-bisphosphate phosphatase